MADTTSSFLARLKQHHIYRVVAGYAVGAWIVIQVTSRVFPYFGWSGAVPILIIILILGFPVVLILAWVFIKPKDPAKSGWQQRHWKLAAIASAVVVILVVISGFYVWRFSAHHAELLAAANTPAASSATAIPAKSVAVLPFVNESADQNRQYFSDGLSEDLITALSQFDGLKVISRDSSFRFRNSNDNSAEIGEKLGVAHLLEGSVQRAGDEVRISAELVNATDGSTLWSQRYDRPYKDLFALQDDITKAVADALKAKLLAQTGATTQSDRPPNGNLAAYNDLLQGRFYSSRDTEADQHKALGYFESAIHLDPHYALAWAGLASVNSTLAGNFLSGSEAARARDQAHDALRTALSLGPDLAGVHAVSAKILSGEDHDWKRAEAEAERAYQLEPDKAFFVLARMRATLGHAGQAVALIRQGLPADPLCAGCYRFMGFYLAALGRFDEAIQANRKAIELQPTYDYARAYLAYIEVMRGDAQGALQAAQQLSPGGNRDQAMAMALTLGGDRGAADAALQAVIAKQSGDAAYQIAEIYALRRDPDSMFKWLERANVNRDGAISYLLTDPPILRYKNDPRFAAFCRKVGLPTTTDAKALP